ncbi:lasso peptide biosynthesis B2 protein [Streptomyces sp. NRRL F-5755]|uniref:lasso peptide biosynthesis B2 protein n=1 Tax=Streptomyces sp. NRRL F-5755 TaxID=1519475 RepID=UPI00099DE105|nr:lasso peptide biosynthesis B2 protein [Streptomyces sp. NRRL F-5755]
MSVNLVLSRGERPPPRQWPAAYLAVAAARWLSGRSPHRISQVLHLVRRGATPASVGQATAARKAVVAVSPRCAIERGCLQRSLATALLCRLRGTWPTWCTGVRTFPYFTAHAWVAVDGQPVGEDQNPDCYTLTLTVAPR